MNNQHMATCPVQKFILSEEPKKFFSLTITGNPYETPVYTRERRLSADFEFKNQPATKLNRRASDITGRDKMIKAHFSSYFSAWRKWEC